MMAPGHLDAVRAIVRERRLRQGDRDRRGRRDPQRDDPARARRHRRRARATCSSTTPCGRCSRRGSSRECFEALEALPGGRRRHPVRRHDHRGRAGQHHPRHPAPRDAPSRPDAPGVPLVGHPPRVRAGRPGPRLRGDRRLHRGAALPARRADLGGPGRRAQHEGHRPDRRLPRRQALPARPHRAHPRASPRTTTATALSGRTVVVFGGSYGIGADICRLAEQYGARVFSFSRSSTGTHVERRDDLVAAARAGARRDRPDRPRRQHRRRPAARHAGRDQRGDDLRRHRRQLPRAGLRRAGLPPAPGGDRRLAAAVHLQLLHPRPQRLQPLLLGEGRDGQPHPGAGRRVGGRRVRVNCINPERTATPMRTKAFGEEPADSLLESEVGGPDLARRAGLRLHRPRDRRTPRDPRSPDGPRGPYRTRSAWSRTGHGRSRPSGPAGLSLAKPQSELHTPRARASTVRSVAGRPRAPLPPGGPPMSLSPARQKKTLGLALAAGLASSMLALGGVTAPSSGFRHRHDHRLPADRQLQHPHRCLDGRLPSRRQLHHVRGRRGRPPGSRRRQPPRVPRRHPLLADLPRAGPPADADPVEPTGLRAGQRARGEDLGLRQDRLAGQARCRSRRSTSRSSGCARSRPATCSR